MHATRSLILGSAIYVLGCLAAGAADLPSKSKGPAVDYVRICGTFGKAFFYIPGTDTCLKISGFIRADYGFRNVTNQFGVAGGNVPAPAIVGGVVDHGIGDVQSDSAAGRQSSAIGVRTRVEFDARTKTAYGTLRGFASIQSDNRSGFISENDPILDNLVKLDKVFIQFAGFTAGRVQSFFDFYADEYPLDISRGSDESTIALAYTASFGGNFSATIALEDSVKRRSVDIGSLQSNVPVPGLPPSPEFRSAIYGGSKIPDVVGALLYDAGDEGWGKAKLSGAYHRINTVNSPAIGAAKANATAWAAQAGIVVYLPMLAKGDEVYAQGAYAVGAKNYLGIDESIGDRTNAFSRQDTDAVAVATGPAATEGVDGGPYRLEVGRGYNVQAGIKHFWAPNVRQYLWAAYTTWNYGAAARNADWLRGGFNNGREFFAGTGVIWSPVKQLDLIADLSYTRLTQKINTSENALPPGAHNNGSSFTARLRLLRKF